MMRRALLTHLALLVGLALAGPARAQGADAGAEGAAALLAAPLPVHGAGAVSGTVAGTVSGTDAGEGAGAPGAGKPVTVGAAGTTDPGAFQLRAGGNLDFHARGLPVADAFAELRRLVKRNIVVDPAVSARFTGDLFDLPADQIVAAICRSSGLVARDTGAFLYIEPDKPETRIYPLRHASAEDVVLLVRPLLSPSGQVSATPASQKGIVSDQEQAGGNDYASTEVVIVRDFHSALEAVDAVIASVDGQPQQVLIEATLLSVALQEGMELGVDFTALIGVDFSDVGGTSPNGTSVDIGGFVGGQLDSGAGNVDTNLTSALSTGGLNIGYLKDGVGVFVRALQETTDATVLANPRVVTLNKQRGEVLLGRRDGFLTTTVTQTSTTQSVEYLETGTRLIFRPFLMGDDLVRLEIHPEDSNGGLTSEGLPFKETTEVTTNVMVRSGETVVIGGLFRERQQTITRKVPFLGDLPLIGRLFRSNDDMSRREEIIVVLTPRILDPARQPEIAVDQRGGPADRAPLPAAAAITVPGLAPADAERVAQAYLSVAASLVQRGDYGSAAMLLSGLDAGQQQRADVGSLRRTIYGLWQPSGVADAVDRRIRDELLEQAP